MHYQCIEVPCADPLLFSLSRRAQGPYHEGMEMMTIKQAAEALVHVSFLKTL